MLFYLMLSSVGFSVPLTMTQQGRIVDSSGAGYEGFHTLHFRFYDAETGGSILWEEVQTVSVIGGYYAAVLGANQPSNTLDEAVLSLYPLYLELTVEGVTMLSPPTVVPELRASAPLVTIPSTKDSLRTSSTPSAKPPGIPCTLLQSTVIGAPTQCPPESTTGSVVISAN